jgi:hypothetical protein
VGPNRRRSEQESRIGSRDADDPQRQPAAHPLLGVQQSAGNRAATAIAQRTEGVQRLALYGVAAAEASALPAETTATFGEEIAAGDQAGAVQAVVAAMTARGELDPELLRTSGEGELWEVREIGDLGAAVSFRSPFPDPDDASRRLPNPRFAVSPRLLRADAPNALGRLHIAILHEFRHVRQTAERVNNPSARGEREPGYANDPDEFDAFLSEVEMSYDRMHMVDAALQAGVSWEFLAAADRVAFQPRWTAAQERIRSVLGYGLDGVLSTSRAEAYREQMRETAQRARAAHEGHAH